MNGECLEFARRVPFEPGQRVLEIGSFDVNGTPRPAFEGADYTGIDMRPGPSVDIVMLGERVHEHFPAGSFDIVVNQNALEHCQDWRGVLRSSWAVLKVGGYYCLNTPTRADGRHAYPDDYWRWELSDYQTMFAGQEVLAMEQVYAAGIGAIVRKVTETLDLDGIEPYAVP